MEIRENTKVYVSDGGKMEELSVFALCVNNNGSIDVLANCNILELEDNVKALYAFYAKQLARMSDQDVYELCKTFDIEYEDMLERVKEARNGQD